MNKYRVFGHTTVTVVTEVFAETETDAYEEAMNQRCQLDSYVGNGGMDKLIGVDSEEESVNADEEITYDDVELLEEGVTEDESDY